MKSMNMMENFTISFIECLLTPCWDKVWQTQGARRKKQSKAGERSIDKKKRKKENSQQETFSRKYFTLASCALNTNNNMNEAMQNSVKTLQTETLFWESLYWCSGSFTFLHFQRKEEESTRQNKC